MSKIMDALLKSITNFLNFLFSHFTGLYKDLNKASAGIPFKYLVIDFLRVLRASGMFLILNILALLVFTALPQGKDILLIVVEEVGQEHRIGNLLFLIAGVILWAIVSEYGTRYAIYVTDNSAKSISEDRVGWRKAVEKAVAQIFLMLPFITVLAGFAIDYFKDSSPNTTAKNIGYGVPALSLYFVFTWMAKFYFDEKRRAKWREENELEAEDSTKKKGGWRRLLILPLKELKWCNKLYGIYNNYIFSIRKPTNFTDKIRRPLEIFSNNFLDADKATRERFPQDKDKVYGESLVPEEFTFVGFKDEKKEDGSSMLEGVYRWEYKIPRNFYKVLHKQLITIVTVCASFFIIICFLNVRFYTNIGTPALVVIAFACYSAFYLGLLFLDYCVLRFTNISSRLLLLLILIISSIVNNDHPVRLNNAGKCCDSRPGLAEHFRNWFSKYEKDSAQFKYHYTGKDPVEKKDTFYPVVFVCAEGGASRTGAYVSMMLSLLQDSLIKLPSASAVDFRKSIYAFSSVSGGSLGVSFFNGMAYLNTKNELLKDSSYRSLAKIFFNEDFLSPVMGKMFYGDIVNLFLPWHVNTFDRAISLEKSWENAYTRIINDGEKNIFSNNYLSFYNKDHTYPAQFINTTEVESGKQCWLTNINPVDTEMLFAKERDLLGYKIKGGINVSTATNFSTRFPLISPGGALLDDDNRKYHYVDGGYVENTGVSTMLEVLKALQPEFDRIKSDTTRRVRIKPYVIVLRFSEEKGSTTGNINFGNELAEIVDGIYNTRAGRSTMANEELRRYLSRKEVDGVWVELPIGKSVDQVPLNWVFSKESLANIEKDVKGKLEHTENNDLKKLLFIDTANYHKSHF